MVNKQRAFGQFATPPDVADLLLAFCLRRPSDRLLDPSCGTGAFLQRAARWQEWLATLPGDVPADSLWGVELDVATAETARTALPQARILTQNFFTLAPAHTPLFDALIGNPPYTRAEWISRLPQVTEFIPPAIRQQLNGRAALHAYFFLHGVQFLREGGRLGFVLPNGWLDVAYSAALKQFLLDHFKIVALIESDVERWFSEAKVNTCLVVLERCHDPAQRAANRVRLVRLRRPLQQLIHYPVDDYRRPEGMERLVSRLLVSEDRQTTDLSVRVLTQAILTSQDKWGVAWRASADYRPRPSGADVPQLQSWATVQRGFTTGANDFFYLDESAIQRWGIEPEFRRPLLKSLRDCHQLRLSTADCRHEVLWLPPTADLSGTAAAHYITWAEEQGYHRRHTCASRSPWYSLPEQSPAHVVLPKGIWRRHSAPLLDETVVVDQQLYQVRLAEGVSPSAAAALLNSAWFILHCELQGRVHFGAGVLWLATYELAAARLPDPRYLPRHDVLQLEALFAQLAKRPIRDIEAELDEPDRQALDMAVFDLLGLTAGERTAVLTTLRERVQARRQQAKFVT